MIGNEKRFSLAKMRKTDEVGIDNLDQPANRQSATSSAAGGGQQIDADSYAVNRVFQPTISDLQLLIGTKEWSLIKVYSKIDENTIDPDQKREKKEIDFQNSVHESLWYDQ